MKRNPAKHKYVYPVKGGYIVRLVKAGIHEQVFIPASWANALQVAIGVRDAFLQHFGLTLD